MSDVGARNVFLTGAASGIGAATTRQLAAAGYRVFAGVHQDPGGLAEIAGVVPVPLDVTDPVSVAAAADQVARAVGEEGVQAVVNNAGVIVQGPLELVPPAELRRQFEVNTFGPAYVIQMFLPLVRAGHGRIVNIIAPTARVPVPFLAPIGASKAALASLSDALRGELATWGIPVCVVDPGGTDTPIFARAAAASQTTLAATDPARAGLYRPQLAATEQAFAKQRLGPPDRIAQAVVKAVTTSRPRRTYHVGTGVALFGVLAHLPAGLRDRIVRAAFGL
ncbi:SDR family NAD(P)-dependent oxidoreductase [Frankia sp. AgB1.9]|uniref:SDR family NAD(P)-dependent oxidoreductase n=1 Tax=unclassified Frankia TaxID=2632575 RepID=UPI0019342ECA|nr:MULTISPECIES: SDR family NAD(P)-dependent oxidoreductase [unclassified Frankia]MBL7488530.1 SDR family NAD(P)-dependent oxidoreductase [Frankia sp. AgW1.1]MBL7550458.1 SDR family NAD(P)-dependent oxidoreductase [Frankia sp. AgB1.9]MBL7620536.1 SDR family NAD(P)-dependent oxidoreductase [Frankia sp. AgB1.8]